jgi:osmotically-inducible protein OsmY
VRASLVDAKDLSASAFKVVTERNVVYLMGRVTQREASVRPRSRAA